MFFKFVKQSSHGSFVSYMEQKVETYRKNVDKNFIFMIL